MLFCTDDPIAEWLLKRINFTLFTKTKSDLLILPLFINVRRVSADLSLLRLQRAETRSMGCIFPSAVTRTTPIRIVFAWKTCSVTRNSIPSTSDIYKVGMARMSLAPWKSAFSWTVIFSTFPPFQIPPSTPLSLHLDLLSSALHMITRPRLHRLPFTS